MSNSLNKCNANETAACCCVDVGTIIDNDESVATYEQTFATEAEAQAKLAALTKRAREVESDPVEIVSEIKAVDNGYHLSASFTFCCGAESLIFQLALR